MKNLSLNILFLAVAFATLAGCGSRNTRNAANSDAGNETAAQAPAEEKGDSINPVYSVVKVGEQMPSFKVQMTDGTVIDTDSLRGKVILLNFWASWCGPCQTELKRAQTDIVDRFEGEDFVFIPIGVQEELENIKIFKADKGYGYPMGADHLGRIYSMYVSSISIPRNFIIDRNGVIVAHERGYMPKNFEKMIEKIDNILKQK